MNIKSTIIFVAECIDGIGLWSVVRGSDRKIPRHRKLDWLYGSGLDVSFARGLFGTIGPAAAAALVSNQSDGKRDQGLSLGAARQSTPRLDDGRDFLCSRNRRVDRGTV